MRLSRGKPEIAVYQQLLRSESVLLVQREPWKVALCSWSTSGVALYPCSESRVVYTTSGTT